ncbi:MAG: ribose-phosphate pyrophosphokinase [Micropruina sp.]|nr:ribose-phosphate pyrophosphokinase [Micropruina sp.]
MSSDITVFSGSANPAFAREVCDLLGIDLSPAHTTRFSNDCLQVHLEANCRKRDVFIVQPLVPPVQENLVELLLMLDAARGASAAHITVVMPHYAYARSDKKDAPRISIGARLVADLLHKAGAQRVVTMALHSPQVHGMFEMPVDHLSATHVIANHFRQRDLSNTVVVSPDFGNVKMANQFARVLDVPVAAGAKRRLADDRVVIDAIVGDVTGKDVIVLDDEIATGGSLMELFDKLRELGVNSISAATVHGLFTGPAIERLGAQDDLREIVCTNTVPVAPEKLLPNLTVLSVAPLFAEAVRRINSGESVSSLFDA